jgi:hypothetical protein
MTSSLNPKISWLLVKLHPLLLSFPAALLKTIPSPKWLNKNEGNPG